MTLRRAKSARLLSTPFILGLLTVSVFTNIILLVRLNDPSLWQNVLAGLRPAPRVLPVDHVRGNVNARVTVIEYSDFQCPVCAEFHASMRRLIRETDTRWIYRHFPLDQIHLMASRAAEASECAGEQGRFWEYADALFERQGEIGDQTFVELSERLGLKLPAFERCMGSGKFRGVISPRRKDAAEKKITGTPTLYVNGRRLDGFSSYENFKRVLIEVGGPRILSSTRH